MADKEIALTIEKNVTGGNGYARHDGRVFFVPFTCQGDRIKAVLAQEKKNYSFAEITAVTQASQNRIQSPCPYYFSSEKLQRFHTRYRYCGGCNFQHIAYPQQLAIKEDILRETLRKIGGMEHVPLEPIIGMEDPWHYRNKIQLPVGRQGNKTLIGFFRPGSHEIVDIEQCLVQDTAAASIIQVMRELIGKYRIMPYDEEHHRGTLRHILIRSSRYSGKALVIFITRTDGFPKKTSSAGNWQKGPRRLRAFFRILILIRLMLSWAGKRYIYGVTVILKSA